MKPDDSLYFDVAWLTFLSKEGIISEAEFDRLENLLQTEPLARQSYLMLINNEHCLYDTDLVMCFSNKGLWDVERCLHELAEYEKTAPTVEIPKEAPDRELIQKVVYPPHTRRTVSKFTIGTFILSTAAMLLLSILIIFEPPQSPAVATLIEQIGTQWQAEPLEAGSEMISGDYYLSRGFAKVGLLRGTEVIIQAPAKFRLESENQLFLLTGKISATVPDQAKGFVARTPQATIVDYGTEFGVEVQGNGRTETHVFKGEVELREGTDPVVHGLAKMLTKNMMCYVDSSGRLGLAKPTAQPNHFIRQMPTSIGYGFAGERLDLADIVGGGNGYGTGTLEQAIDPITGKVTSEFIYKPRKGSGGYVSVDSLPYVDGVFVPDGGQGSVQVSSYGHLFDNCIDTSGNCYRNIANGFRKGQGVHKFRGLMNGVEYGTLQKPAISMHSNTGLTFDLDQIRKGIPGMKISGFDAMGGISGNVKAFQKFQAAFYVLVDGEIKFEITGTHKELMDIPIRVELSDQDRFLTLIAVDGGDDCSNDWCTFAMPGLELIRTE